MLSLMQHSYRVVTVKQAVNIHNIIEVKSEDVCGVPVLTFVRVGAGPIRFPLAHVVSYTETK